MKIRNLKIKMIGPVLLLIPMACMHLGDGHHTGSHHSSFQELCQSPSYGMVTGNMMGQMGMATRQADEHSGHKADGGTGGG